MALSRNASTPRRRSTKSAAFAKPAAAKTARAAANRRSGAAPKRSAAASARPRTASARRAGGPNLRTRLESLARNLWWTWNGSVKRLFASIDPREWRGCGHNPIELLARVPAEQLAALQNDPEFLAALGGVEAELAAYLRARTWYDRAAKGTQRRLRVAYFCAEFALHESLAQYAGGLGVLAGDHLKSASDLGVPLVAVGLLYRSGYYQQRLAENGATQPHYPLYDYSRLPLTDTKKVIRVPLGRETLYARVWRAQVGRVPLLMLDADIPKNPPRLRAVTHTLYGGDNETRIQQEILLGVGGMSALDALDLAPTVIHLNEGHAAFAALERYRRLIAAGRPAKKARAEVAARTVFTTHTPVPAGHDRFDFRLMDHYFADWPRKLGMSRDQFLALGREPDNLSSFCMTVLALNFASHCNGVSKLNGDVARRMWAPLFGLEARPDKVPIGHVTNGVHPQTWIAPEAEPFYAEHLKPRWIGAGPDDDWWKNAERIPPAALWELRSTLRARLVHFIRERTAQQLVRRRAGMDEIARAWRLFDPDALTLGFARRFATYKRAPLIFSQPQRLARLLNDPGRPVQLVFAGKAHPRDMDGQRFAQLVHEFSQRPEFRDRVVLLENYDMEVGRALTSGCDVWLNTPLRPREASGTSGMKPPLHGGLNCSILDGWWPEAFDGDNGWAIDDGKSEDSGPAVDARDAESVYSLLENEIVPLFYTRDRAGLPQEWLRRAAHSMRTVCAQFSTHRMVADYVRSYYWPAHP